jgi:hypothetical protein
METLPCEASAFWFTWNKTEESHSYRRAYLAGSAAFVSLSSRMTDRPSGRPSGLAFRRALRRDARLLGSVKGL